jgi:YidC/Oxa1 family membrane protein insertase
MNPLSVVYNEILFRPIFNLLVAVTNLLPTHSIAWAIIVVTLIVRLILMPATIHQARQAQKNQKKLTELQLQLKKIQEQYATDRAKQAQETMALYRQAGINPAAGCLPLLLQLPVLIAMYQVFLSGLKPELWQYLYSFVAQPGNLNLMFFTVDITQPNVWFGVAAGVAQFIQMRFSAPAPTLTPGGSDDQAKTMQAMQKNMMYIFPVMTVFIALSLPAALALYWFVSTVFGVLQQYLLKRTMKVAVNVPMG